MNYDNNSPSQRIFFEKQLPLIKKFNVTFVKDFKKADIVIIPRTKKQVNFLKDSKIISFIKEKKIKILIIKPHMEIDTRLNYKNNIDLLKSIFNRIFKSQKFYNLPNSFKELRTTLICDSRRLERHFMTNNWKTLYLPLSYNTEIKEKINTQIDLLPYPEIAFIGEITHLIEWIDELKFLLEKKEFKNYKLKIISFGPVSKRKIEKKIGKNKIIWGEPTFNIDSLNQQLLNVVFGIVPHQIIHANYEGLSINRINPFTSQPNNVLRYEKFSCNTGRNHLFSSLSIPFITSPVEDVIIEFKDYPSFLFIENKYQLYFAAKKLQNLNLRNSLSTFLRNNYEKNFMPEHVIETLFSYLKSEK